MAERRRLHTRLKNNIRDRLISGMLVLVPIGVTLLVMRWLFARMAGLLEKPIREVLDYLKWQPTYWEYYAWAVSILALLVMLYFVGVLARMMVGRRIIRAAERPLMRIPLVKTLYGATKQVVSAVSLPDRGAFKAVVTLEFPARGMRTIAFITGTIKGIDGRDYYKVFIPTTPNITTGFFELVLPEKVEVTSLTVEEALKTIISGGILAPARLHRGQGVLPTGPANALEADDPGDAQPPAS
ncbi:MAG TPA: DUF502 domain-containing protein [Phycisphaerae bacterium]|nr:DUF502 domain-containing protein [Phycisphaerae bacterium]